MSRLLAAMILLTGSAVCAEKASHATGPEMLALIFLFTVLLVGAVAGFTSVLRVRPYRAGS